MILYAKKIENTWTIQNESNEILAKAKIQKKKTGTYGKIIYQDGTEQELLFNKFACKNGRLKVNIFDKKNLKTALYRDIKLTNKKSAYFSYRLKFESHSYIGYHVKSSKIRTDFYIYDNKNLITILSRINQNEGLHVDLFVDEHVSLKMIVAYMISHQIFMEYPRLFTNEYAPEPLNRSDILYICKMKENYLKETFL